MTLPPPRAILLAIGGLLLGVGLGVTYNLFSSPGGGAQCSTTLQDSLTAPDSSLRGLLYRTTCREPLGTSLDVAFDSPGATPATAPDQVPQAGPIAVEAKPTGEIGLAWRSADTLVVLQAGAIVGTWRRIRDPQSGQLVLVRLPARRSD